MKNTKSVAIVTRVPNVAESKGIAALPPPPLGRLGSAKLPQTEKVCCPAPAMLLEDILSRLLPEKQT